MGECARDQQRPTEDKDHAHLPGEVAGRDSVADSPRQLVVIHPWVDLDAAACVALTGVELEDVYFLPANAAEIPPEFQNARILDHPLGMKGLLEQDGVQHSAAASLPEAADLVGSDLLAEIEEQDMLGYAQPRFSLARILACLRSYFADKQLEGEELDRAVLRVIVPVLRALAHAERQNRAAAKTLPPEIEVGPHRFVLRIGRSTGPIALPRNYSGIIYHDGFNLGVVRHPRRREIDFRLLREDLPGWFIHPTGFMACWGSFKAPATTLPPPGTPQNVVELVELLRRRIVPPPEEEPSTDLASGQGGDQGSDHGEHSAD